MHWLARRAERVVVGGVACALLLAGCSDDDRRAAQRPSTPPVPVPRGVELTEPGSSLRVGEAAIAPYVTSPGPGAVVRVKVRAIERGTSHDFAAFNLDPVTARSTPWYVRASMAVLGDGQVRRAALPVFGYDSAQTFFPAADIQGGLDECPATTPPQNLRSGDVLRSCLVFFVPRKRSLEAVQLRGEDNVPPISWTISKQPKGDGRPGD